MKVFYTRAICSLAYFFIGCQTHQSSLPPSTIEELSAMAYPETSAYGEDLEIYIRQAGRLLHISNTSANAYENMTLWINQEWASTLDTVKVGANVPIDLTNCINLHHEPFPIGQILRPELTHSVVIAELYNPETQLRHRMITLPTLD